ncbi:MAG: lectin like domain-containing protein [Propionibacteriaceae bacterium]|jgi:hypothetical protein|nr:lectin like domain-containing protein [Propionibacteriaceae bacterium]
MTRPFLRRLRLGTLFGALAVGLSLSASLVLPPPAAAAPAETIPTPATQAVIPAMGTTGPGLGYLPSGVDRAAIDGADYSSYTAGLPQTPAKFDLRDRGVVPPVRDQGSWGDCWAFAATGSAATTLAAHGQNNVLLSPRHLAYSVYNELGVTAVRGPTGTTRLIRPMDQGGNGETYEVTVYTGVATDPATGKKQAYTSQSGAVAIAGCHRIAFDTPAQLKAGQKFAIVVKMTDTSAAGQARIFAENTVAFRLADGSTGVAHVESSANESYISPDGVTWKDVGAGNAGNFSIKALTSDWTISDTVTNVAAMVRSVIDTLIRSLRFTASALT